MRLGRAMAQGATERMAFARAKRLTEPQPCPTCERQCTVVYREPGIGDGGWTDYSSRTGLPLLGLYDKIFFPQRPELGLDQPGYSPAVTDKIVSANAEHKSASKAQKMLRKLAEIRISVPPNPGHRRGRIGEELREHLERQARAHARVGDSAPICRGSQGGGCGGRWRSHHDACGSRSRRA